MRCHDGHRFHCCLVQVDPAVLQQFRKIEVRTMHTLDGLAEMGDTIRIQQDLVTGFDTARLGIIGMNLGPVFRPTLGNIGPAIHIIETGLPDFVDTAVGMPQLILLRAHPLPVIREQAPGVLLDIDFAGLGVEVGHLLVDHVRTLGTTFPRHLLRGAFGIVQTHTTHQLAGLVVVESRSLDTLGPHLPQLLMQGLAFFVGSNLDHVISLAVTATETGGLFTDFVGVLPVVAVKTQTLRQLRDNPPVRFGIARCIIELGVQADTAFTVGPYEVLFSPGGRRQHDVGKLGTDGIAQVDVLIEHNRTTRVHTLLQRIDDVLLVGGTHLVLVISDQFLELVIQAL